MIIILGLIVLAAAVAVAVAGVLGNGGTAHPLTHGFAVFGYHVTGSSGTVFLAGIVVGVVGLFGLILLVTGARRGNRRRMTARRKLQQSRRETAAVSQDRDNLTEQLKAARKDATSTQANGAPQGDPARNADEGGHAWPRVFGHRSDPRQATATQSRNGQLVPDVPADSSADGE